MLNSVVLFQFHLDHLAKHLTVGILLEEHNEYGTDPTRSAKEVLFKNCMSSMSNLRRRHFFFIKKGNQTTMKTAILLLLVSLVSLFGYVRGQEIREISGMPSHLVGEIVIKFTPEVLNVAAIDSTAKVFTMNELVLDTFLNQLSQQFSGISDWQVEKLFPGYGREDSVKTSRSGVSYKTTKWWSIFILRIPVDLDELLIADSLENNFTEILYSHPNWLLFEDFTPNDPLYLNQQNDLFSSLQLFQNGHVNVERAWDFQPTGASFVKMGIQDSGIDQGHPDLLVTGGAKFATYSPSPLTAPFDPNSGHGTSVAGLAAASSNNNVGIAGVASGVSLYNVAITGAEDVAKRVAALNYAIDFLECHIVNCSWSRKGDRFTENKFELLAEAIYNGHKAGVIMVCSRGNNNDADGAFPASFADPMVLSVLATNETGNRASFSSFGGSVDLGAPGIATAFDGTNQVNANLTTKSSEVGDPTVLYTTFEGVSASCPIVSGASALILSNFNSSSPSLSNLTPTDVENILQLTASDRGVTGYDDQTGWGLLNIGLAIELIQPPKYNILHYESSSPSSTVSETQGQPFPFHIHSTYGTPVAGGNYLVKRYRVNFQVFHNISANVAIMAAWPRFESSIGYSSQNPNPGFDQVYIDEVTNNFAKLHTYTYEVYNVLGQQIGWVPASPSNLKVAYSLYTNDLAIVSATSPELDSADYFLFPNPCTSEINLEIKNRRGVRGSVKLVDMQGKLMSEHQLPSGINGTLPIDVKFLTPGMYGIVVNSNDRIHFLRFVKIN